MSTALPLAEPPLRWAPDPSLSLKDISPASLPSLLHHLYFPPSQVTPISLSRCSFLFPFYPKKNNKPTLPCLSLGLQLPPTPQLLLTGAAAKSGLSCLLLTSPSKRQWLQLVNSSALLRARLQRAALAEPSPGSAPLLTRLALQALGPSLLPARTFSDPRAGASPSATL